MDLLKFKKDNFIDIAERTNKINTGISSIIIEQDKIPEVAGYNNDKFICLEKEICEDGRIKYHLNYFPNEKKLRSFYKIPDEYVLSELSIVNNGIITDKTELITNQNRKDFNGKSYTYKVINKTLFNKSNMCMYKLFLDNDKRCLQIYEDKLSIYHLALRNILGTEETLDFTLKVWALNLFTNDNYRSITYINGKTQIGKSIFCNALKQIFGSGVSIPSKNSYNTDRDEDVSDLRFHILDEIGVNNALMDKLKQYTGNMIIDINPKMKELIKDANVQFYNPIICNNNKNIQLKGSIDEFESCLNRFNYIERQHEDVISLKELTDGFNFDYQNIFHKYIAMKLIGCYFYLRDNKEEMDNFIKTYADIQLSRSRNMIKLIETGNKKTIGCDKSTIGYKFITAIKEIISNDNYDIMIDFINSDDYNKVNELVRTKKNNGEISDNIAEAWYKRFGSNWSEKRVKSLNFKELKYIYNNIIGCSDKITPKMIGLVNNTNKRINDSSCILFKDNIIEIMKQSNFDKVEVKEHNKDTEVNTSNNDVLYIEDDSKYDNPLEIFCVNNNSTEDNKKDITNNEVKNNSVLELF